MRRAVDLFLTVVLLAVPGACQQTTAYEEGNRAYFSNEWKGFDAYPRTLSEQRRARSLPAPGPFQTYGGWENPVQRQYTYDEP